ncbi:hypothetical protein KBY65_07560 [Cyanobium sp. Alchichica 3B3-8F6]|nr:hypothetical protein [Cyanobium sp. Alchichica 3B3-8F6]
MLITQIGRKVLYRLTIASAIGLLIAALLRESQGLKALLRPSLIGSWIAAIVLMAVGSLFEKQGLMLLEELFELAGQSLVLLSAWLHRNAMLPSRA